MNQRPGMEELREQSVCKLAGLLLPTVAKEYNLVSLSDGGRDEAHYRINKAALSLAASFQAEAEERCKKAQYRDQLAGNT